MEIYYFYVPHRTVSNAFTFERILFISNHVYRLNMVFYRLTTNQFSYKF